jgi:hypothetical protein
MSRKRVRSNLDFAKQAKWDSKGEEQATLDELLSSGTLIDQMTPSVARELDPIFGNFSLPVFTYHLKKARLASQSKFIVCLIM